MVDLARHSIMHALIAALLLGSHSVATATATVQSAPGSIFLAHAFVGNQAQQELLHNEFYCVSTDSSKPPKALEELRKRCSTNPAYKILMRLLATVPGEKPPSRKVSLLEYVNSYQSTFANLLTSLDPIKLNDRLNRLRKFEATKSYGEEQKKAARQELVGSEVYKELKKSFKDNVIDEVVDKILSLNYLDYAKETVKSAYLRLGKDLSGDDFMDDDDALKGVFKQLGPVLTLSEVLSCKRTQDFYVNLVGQDDHWLTGYGSVVKRIFSIMNYMYMQMPTDDFDKVIKECEKVRLQAIDLVSKQKTITEKLKTISDQEKEIIKAIELATVTLKAPQWIQAFNDFKAALEEVHKKTIDQSQQKHENIYIARELRLNKPRTLDIVAQSEDVQMSPSMYYVLNSEDLLNGILNPAGWKTKISSLANPNDPFSKRLFELVKDLNIDVKAMQLDRAHSVNLPTILLPQTIMLAEHESWRFSLQDHLYKEELTHADRVKLYKALQELSGVKDKVAAPSLAIYELDGEVLLTPSSAYTAIDEILKKTTRSRVIASPTSSPHTAADSSKSTKTYTRPFTPHFSQTGRRVMQEL